MARVSDKKMLVNIMVNECRGYSARRECRYCCIRRSCDRISRKYYEQDAETRAISRKKMLESATRKYIKLYGTKDLRSILCEALI